MKHYNRFVKKIILFLFSICAVFYALSIAILYFGQRSLIFPGAFPHRKPHHEIAPPDQTGKFVHLKTKSECDIVAYWTPPAAHVPDAGRTIVFFYGNGVSLRNIWRIVERFRKTGCSVMAADYPGME